MEPPRGRSEHHAKARRSIHDQGDVDGVIVTAADELLGSVERIDEEEGVFVRRDSTRCDLLLGDHRNAWGRLRQRRENDQFGSSVGFRHRRAVAFRLDLESAPDDRADRFPGFARGLGDLEEEERIVARQRGAIRIPPSSLTAAAFM